ncbi:MAG: GAF domain-containing protein [Anaerolineae bacterium]|nr:GAF domain-containing protein [Anaerolineae bacterium]
MRHSRIPVFSWGLGLCTLAVLVTHIPQTDDLDIGLWLFFAALVALMLNIGTMFSEGVVSPASTAALMAYLTIGDEGDLASAALWCVAAGSLIGNLAWLLRTPPSERSRREYSRVVKSIVVGTAQLTLGLFVAGWMYRAVGGDLPLVRLDKSQIAPLVVFVAAYLLVHLGIMFLEAYLALGRTPRKVLESWQGSAQSILLPLPFAAVGAVAYHELTQLAFLILIGGLLTVVTGVNLLSRTQARYRQQVLELSSLSAVSQALGSSLDLNALLDVIYEKITQLLDVDNFTVALFDANRNILYFPLNVQNHRRVPLEPRAAGNGLMERVIKERAALLIDAQVPRRAKLMGMTPPLMPVYSWLGVPLLAADRVLGCIVVHAGRSDQHFTSKDMGLLTTVAAQAGIAIDNSQLYSQARDRAMQLATLNNIATIFSGTLDVHQILDLVGSSSVAVASCSAVALFMWWDNANQTPSLARHNGLSDDFARDPIWPLLLEVGDLQHRRQPVIVTDSFVDQHTQNLRAQVERERKRAWVECLVRKGDELLGILVFYYDTPRRFGSDEVELLRNFSNQAALAISNARLYTQTDAALNRRVEQLSALADISRELTSTLNLQGLFQVVLDRALEATESRNGMLLLRTEDGEPLPNLVAHRGFADRVLERGNPLAGFVAQAYQTGYPTLIADIAQEETHTPLDDKTRAQLNVPIMRGQEVLGVISLGSDRPSDYGQEDLSFVTQLAVQARIAIDNARLFRRIEVARDRLQVILDSMKEGVILIGSDGYMTLANPRVERLLGLDPRRLTQAPVVDLIRDADLKLAERLGFAGSEALSAVLGSLNTGRWDDTSQGSGRFTFEVVGPDKRRFVDRTDAPVRDEKGRALGLLMVFSDVTEERELAQARDDLSNMIVHDLRGPLTAITTSLKLLNEIAPDDDPLGRAVKETTDMSSRAVRKMLNLVNSLLDISKLESGVIALEYEPTQLRPLTQAIMDELAPLAQELDVRLQIDMPESLPTLNTDPDKIERVILNLVDNAIKFTPSEGQVTIAAYPPGERGAAANFVRVDVRDTGPGVPDEHKERLFDRYAQIDGQRGRRRGTGLGLTFCQLAVEAHGGRIWIEDNPQGGSVFAFTLPVADLDSMRLPE